MKKAIAIILLAATIASCKKLIEVPPTPSNMIETERVFADSVGVMGVLAGIYTNMKASDYGFTPTTSGLQTITTALAGDELNYNGVNNDVRQFPVNGILANNAYVGGMWTAAYAVIYQVNACLGGMSRSTTITTTLKHRVEGEVRFVRAFEYFNLVNLYNGVPLVLATDYNITAKQPRATVDLVYDQIIADLTAARQLLKAAYPSTGRARPNLYAASALLAKVYLYRGKWREAANLATEVIQGPYTLPGDLSTIFLDGSNEAIWQLPAKSNGYQTMEGYFLQPSYAGAVPDYSLTDYLFNAFETNDKRKTQWTNTATVAGKAYTYPYKYRNANSYSATTTESYMMLRLGEQFLIRAEALAQLNKTDSARDDLNQVRQRAGVTKSMAATQADLLSAIMHERQIELFCEWGNRWFDLRRTGTADAVLGTRKVGWKSTWAVFPIPYAEIQNNPKLEQNKDYY